MFGGGTASLLGGGKFANGAFSGAFVYLFNHQKGFWGGVKEFAKGFKLLGKMAKETLNLPYSKIGKSVINGTIGGAKGLHSIMVMDPKSVKGGIIGQALFEYATLKIGAGSGSHVGYEIVPSEMLWTTRMYGYTNPLIIDTAYTTGSGNMFSIKH